MNEKNKTTRNKNRYEKKKKARNRTRQNREKPNFKLFVIFKFAEFLSVVLYLATPYLLWK